ncbi:uncharacterized protein LOC142235291 [Haematobia irritans]|uniref:uncharacterized protein LOC142235291 n=1 Tax=Haematobia irritans TaxID=7368 RepID=UPI003F501EC3
MSFTPFMPTMILAFLATYPQETFSKMFYVQSVTISHNPVYVDDYWLKINSGNTSLDLGFLLSKTIPYNPWMKMDIKLRRGKENKFQSILKYDVNICEIFNKATSKLLLKWIDDFWKYGNLPKSCPIHKGNYSWHNMQIDSSNVPNFFPIGVVGVDVKMYIKKRNRKFESLANTTYLMEWK